MTAKKIIFWLTINKRDKIIQEYIRLSKVTNIEYQKLFNENKIQKARKLQKKTEKEEKNSKKREYNKEETDTEIETEESEPEEPEEKPEPTIYRKIKR